MRVQVPVRVEGVYSAQSRAKAALTHPHARPLTQSHKHSHPHTHSPSPSVSRSRNSASHTLSSRALSFLALFHYTHPHSHLPHTRTHTHTHTHTHAHTLALASPPYTQNFTDALVMGGPRLDMAAAEGGRVQRGAYLPGKPATHTGKILYPECKKVGRRWRVWGGEGVEIPAQTKLLCVVTRW